MSYPNSGKIVRYKLTVRVYRPIGEVKLLVAEDKLTISELFPGWKIAISKLWSPVFE